MMNPAHSVAVVGGAVAGSEAARVLAEQGVEVVVFERNGRPYGKIEDGLPLWHAEQRRSEYRRIDERLNRPGVFFVPKTALGTDVTLDGLVNDWGFSAVLLATGAWRDRLPRVPEIEQYVDKGLVLQNKLVYWFNHYREQGYRGPQFEIPDQAVVFGGGLASIDVVKILMLETVNAALAKRDIDVDIIELERKGIAKTLETHDLSLADLGLGGCTLYYRRRKVDMPLAEVPEGATPERVAKVEHVRAKILDNAMKKYLFNYQERTLPVSTLVDDGRLVGLTCVRTEIVEGRAKPLFDTAFELRAPFIVSSLGSVPEPLSDLEMSGDYYRIVDEATGAIEGFDNVFGAGNVVTGKGNIRVSRKHAAFVGEHLVKDVLDSVSSHLRSRPALSADQVTSIRKRVKERQQAIGYQDYGSWIQSVTAPDMM